MINSADILLKSLFVLQILFIRCVLASSPNTISVNQTLKDDGSVLVSAGGRYTLGFFSPGKSTLRYIGIWFSFSNTTVVWVANRDNPINDTSGVLSLTGDGNLVLSDDRTHSVWSTNVPSSSTKAIARFSADGNVAVVHNEKEVTWQSFDHPTHVLLAGMKVGIDLRTGLNRVVTAWKSADDPGSSGVFLRMDPAGSPQLILYKNRSKWWRAGHWNGLQWSGVPALGSLPRVNLFNITFKNDRDEITVAWNVLDSSLVTFVAVNATGDGTIRQNTWQSDAKRWVEIYSAPGDICDPYAVCGPNGRCDPYNVTGYVCSCLPGYGPRAPHDWALRDGSGGCDRPMGALSMCRSGEGFARIRGVKVPDAASAVVAAEVGPAECRSVCLENCSCLGYGVADVKGTGSGCMMWYGEALMDVKQFLQGGQDLYVRVDSLELVKYKEKTEGLSRKSIAVIVGVAIGVFLISICAVLYCLRKRKKLERVLLGQPQTLQHNVSASSDQAGDNAGEKSDIFFFDLSTVAAATDNFSSANKLGQGGFGAVYKGVLGDGQELAVKRLSQFSGQGTEEFKNEVVLIAKLQHRNLVKLLGCCINNEEKMLVYEYLPNKSLDLVLFDKNKKLMLDWRHRSQIVLGIARGLLYLHQDSRLKIIHRDLKASNVLLDATMIPKISDFGMARMFGDDQIEANTNKVVGTYGYMSPEYAMEGLYSTKSDVFSFGVLMLEILTGKKNSHFNEVSSLNLVGQVWDLWTEKRVIEIVDEMFDQSDHHLMNRVLRWIHIGLLCVQELAVDRPIMSEVIFMLGNESLLPYPKRPAFIFKNTGSDTSTSKGVSVNNITITVMEPR